MKKLLTCTDSAVVETKKIIDKVPKKQVFFVSKKVREELGERLFQGGGGGSLKTQ